MWRDQENKRELERERERERDCESCDLMYVNLK